jgi:3-isopropylmalate dehydrogenase
MLLEHLGLDKAAARIENAVAADLASRDQRVSRRTAEVGDAIAARISG